MPENIFDQLRSRIAASPTGPGVYRWMNKSGDVLYVGKAKNLRNRLRSYVKNDPNPAQGPWKLALLKHITDVNWTITETEIEALVLESNLIKELKPKYNVMLKDDKNYVYVQITMKDAYPSVSIVRRMEDENAKYFGPYLSAGNLKKTLEMLHTVYGFRACKRSIDTLNKYLLSSTRVERPLDESSAADSLEESNLKQCLDHQIGKCNGLCIGTVDQKEYNNRINSVIRFLKGDRKDVLSKLEEMMQAAVVNKKFEQAASLRDTLRYIKSLEDQQIVSDTSGDNTDAIGIALLSNKAQVVVIRERGGKMLSDRSYMLQGEADTEESVLEQFIPQYYQLTDDIPETILCSEQPESYDTLEEWLSDRHSKKVIIHAPEKGKKNKLLQMAQTNADEKVKQQLASWEAATQKVDQSLSDLQTILKLKEKPKRIECYDISHFDGSDTVGSMVVAHNGKMKNTDYRSFTIRTMKKGEVDDYKALSEVLTRRLRHLAAREEGELERLKKEGIELRKMRKADTEAVEAIMKEAKLDTTELDTKQVMLAELENEKEIIGLCRLKIYESGLQECSGLWIKETYRGDRLGYVLMRSILKKIKKGKAYLLTDPALENHYADLGFVAIHKTPKELEEKIKHVCKKLHNWDPVIMMYEAVKNKPDTSLTSTPDLIVLDGGKGQLSAGLKVLKTMKIDIPMIGLAKREEEVFTTGSSHPLSFKKDAEGLFLLMRLRDEAHRFANRHREKRAKNTMFTSL